MSIEEYRKKFTDLFLEMEKEHGHCIAVEIEKGDCVYDGCGEVLSEKIICKIHF